MKLGFVEQNVFQMYLKSMALGGFVSNLKVIGGGYLAKVRDGVLNCINLLVLCFWVKLGFVEQNQEKYRSKYLSSAFRMAFTSAGFLSL